MKKARGVLNVWIDGMEYVGAFTTMSKPAEGADLRRYRLTESGMTVQSCEEMLVVSQATRDPIDIAQAIDGMRSMAAACLIENSSVWRQYFSEFSARHQVQSELVRAFPFLRAIIFASRFEEIRKQIVGDLSEYNPIRFASPRRGLCDVGNLGGAEYRDRVETRRKELAAAVDCVSRNTQAYSAWVERISTVVSPAEVIAALRALSRGEVPCSLEGMQQCASMWLHRIDAGRF